MGALAVLLPALPVPAQERSTIDPGEARLQRELRSLEGRIESAPRGAGLQLQRARRDLIREGRGSTFAPGQGRIDRELDRLGRELRERQAIDRPEARPPPATRGDLPASYGEVEDGLPSSLDRRQPAAGRPNNLVTATRLIDRAETALDDGRPVQARSDLSTARGFLGGVGGGDPVAAATLARLKERLESLEQRLAAAEAG